MLLMLYIKKSDGFARADSPIYQLNKHPPRPPAQKIKRGSCSPQTTTLTEPEAWPKNHC